MNTWRETGRGMGEEGTEGEEGKKGREEEQERRGQQPLL